VRRVAHPVEPLQRLLVATGAVLGQRTRELVVPVPPVRLVPFHRLVRQRDGRGDVLGRARRHQPRPRDPRPAVPPPPGADPPPPTPAPARPGSPGPRSRIATPACVVTPSGRSRSASRSALTARSDCPSARRNAAVWRGE